MLGFLKYVRWTKSRFLNSKHLGEKSPGPKIHCRKIHGRGEFDQQWLSRALIVATAVIALSGCLPQEVAQPVNSSNGPSATQYAGFAGVTATETVGAKKIKVSWTASTDPNVAAYNVYDTTLKFKPTLIKTVAAPASDVTITGLTAQNLYYFRVRAADNNGKEDANSKDLAAIPFGGATSNQVINGSSAYINFGEAGNLDKVNVYCKVGGSEEYQLKATVTDTAQTSAKVQDLIPGTKYTCKANAVVGGFMDNNVITTSFTPMGQAARLEFTTQPSSSLAGTPFGAQPVVKVVDKDGNVITAGVDATVAITLSLASSSPSQGSIRGAATISAIGGVATFSGINIEEAGTKILNAVKSDTSTQVNGSPLLTVDSERFTISPGAVSASKSTIAISPEVPPAPALTANGSSAYSVTITLQDDYGNPITGVKPTFASSIAGDIISQPTQNSNSLGVATGSISSTIADTLPPYRTLRISSPSGLTSVTKPAPFAAGVATKLAFSQQPVNSPSGNNNMATVRVAIQDAQGNTVMTGTTASSTVTLSIASNVNGAVLSGTSTVTAVDGVATFSDLGIDKTASGYKLAAAATSLTTTYSNTFNITAGTPRKIIITGPANTLSGACSTAITVQLQDNGGNPTNTTQNTPVILSGLSSANLYTSSACAGTAISSTLTFTAGTNTKTLYMKDIKSEAVNLTATDTSGVLTTGSFVLNVSPNKIKITAEAPPPMASGNPLSVVAGRCSAPIVVTPLGENGAAGPLFAITPVIISGISGSSAQIYSDSSCTQLLTATNVLLPITLGAGYSINLYLKDNKSENLNLSVTDPAAQMTTVSALQPVTITPSMIEFSGPSSVVAGKCSSAFTVSLKDAAGNVVRPSANTSLTVTGLTTSASAMFYTSPTCGGAGSQTTVVIPQDGAAAVVYLKDNLAETLSIAIQDPAALMTTSASLTVGVSPSAMTIVGPTPNTTTSSQCTGPFDVKSVDGVGTVTAAITPINGTLGGAGAAGAFYSDSSCLTTVTNFTIATGQNSYRFYFKGQYPATNLQLSATDVASVLDPGTLSFNVTAAPGWIGTEGTNLASNGSLIWFTPGVVPVSARSNGASSVYSMHFDATKRYLYVADSNSHRVLKYDYQAQSYIGWIGGYTSSGAIGVSGSNLTTPSPALCVATTNNQPLPGWCVGGASYASGTSTNGVMYTPGAITDDGTYIYVAQISAHSVTRYRADTGAYAGYIGTVNSPPTGSGPGGPPSCTSTASSQATPGWCTGGSNTYNNFVGDGGFRNPRTLVYQGGYLYVGVEGAIYRYDASSGAFTGWIGMVGAVSPTGGAAGCNTTGNGTRTPGWCIGGTYQTVNPKTFGGGGGVNIPRGMIVIGNILYVAHTDSSGTITTYDLTSGAFLGLLPNLSYNWPGPFNLAYDGTNLYAADVSRITKFDPATGLVLGWMGKVSNNASMSGNPGCSTLNPNDDTPGWCLGGTSKTGLSESSFSQAYAVVYDGAGSLLVGQGSSHPAIKKFNATTGEYEGTLSFKGISPTSWSNDGNAFAQYYGFDDNSMWAPSSSVNDGSFIYLTEASSARIKKINQLTGKLIGWIGGITSRPTGGSASCLAATAFGPSPDWCTGSIFNPTYLWNSMIGQTVDGIFERPMGITSDGTYLYIVDVNQHRIQRFNKTSGLSGGWIGGIGTTPTGGAAGCAGAPVSTFTPGWCTGGLAASGSGNGFLSSPSALTYANGNLYVIDSANSRVASYNATTGGFNGWIGAIGTNPSSGCTYGSNGAYNVSQSGWCIGGTAVRSSVGGDRGGGFSFWTSHRGGIYSDGSFLYISNFDNGRIDKYSYAGVWQGAARTLWSSYVNTWTTNGATLTAWSGNGYTGIWGDGTHLYGAITNAVVKMNLTTGTVVGWRGAINPGNSPTGGGPGCAGATIVTPDWCQGGNITSGYRMGQFSGAYSVSGDANYIYVGDENSHRLTRLPK